MSFDFLREEYFACLALRHTPGLGPCAWGRILNHYTGAYEALKDCRNWPVLKLASDACSQNAASEQWRPKAESEYREAVRLRLGILPWSHPLFPRKLKEIADPPACLYYLGDSGLLANPAVGVVGSRKSCRLGQEYASRISGDLSRKGITVVSGFARGIDSCAHRAALSEVGSTIAVLGTGLDVEDYPKGSGNLRKEMIAGGLLLSEFTPGTKPYSNNFPYRNRIISGLSTGVLVVEADAASGSLITARLAGEQGREVMAMPGPSGDSCFAGCLRLLKEGAALVETADDVLLNIGHALDLHSATQPATAKVQLRRGRAELPLVAENNVHCSSAAVEMTVDISGLVPPESDIAAILKHEGKLHADEIAQKTGCAASLVSATLVGLEVKGIVVRFPGMYYDLMRC